MADNENRFLSRPPMTGGGGGGGEVTNMLVLKLILVSKRGTSVPLNHTLFMWSLCNGPGMSPRLAN